VLEGREACGKGTARPETGRAFAIGCHGTVTSPPCSDGSACEAPYPRLPARSISTYYAEGCRSRPNEGPTAWVVPRSESWRTGRAVGSTSVCYPESCPAARTASKDRSLSAAPPASASSHWVTGIDARQTANRAVTKRAVWTISLLAYPAEQCSSSAGLDASSSRQPRSKPATSTSGRGRLGIG